MTRVVAFLLPQFHPIPENDRWWGEGFTEWTNVRRARPLFPGHHQPQRPADLGYYDLRDEAVRARLAGLAASYGIAAFCWYHYWFDGQRLLEAPFDAVLASGRPDLPFCMCWANEPWSRRWDGSDEEVLQPQRYSAEDDEVHITALLPALTDARALKVEGRPVFLVYRAEQLPHAAGTAGRWRAAARRAGLPGLHLVAVEASAAHPVDPRAIGFDATVRFQPDWRVLDRTERLSVGPPSTRVYSYPEVWPALAEAPAVGWRRYPAVCTQWDNTARRGADATVLHGSTPRHYERWLDTALAQVAGDEPDHRLVFVNGWNEWGEGCHLEPDRRFGHAYLRATRRALRRASLPSPGELSAVAQ
jgi:lipopolysaccharide biosynthesis protein